MEAKLRLFPSSPCSRRTGGAGPDAPAAPSPPNSTCASSTGAVAAPLVKLLDDAEGCWGDSNDVDVAGILDTARLENLEEGSVDAEAAPPIPRRPLVVCDR
jgi:hypothetical protein